MIFGLTGGIGSGKSTVSQYLVRKCGFFAIDADVLTREVHGDAAVCEALVAAFGDEVAPQRVGLGRCVDRSALGRVAFGLAEGVAQLNRIMHPALEARLCEALERASTGDWAHGVVDAALLYEAGWARFVDRVVAVVAPPQMRIERVALRDGLPREQIAKRMASQIGVGEMCRRADDIIYNVGGMDALERQISAWCAKIAVRMRARA